MKKTKYILISTLLFLLLTGCGSNDNNTGNNSTNQGNNNGTNAVEDIGDGVIDGVENAGDGIIDGAEDIGNGVKKSMDNMMGKNGNNNSSNSGK